jgi:N-acetyl-alpha-D-glucosaminyl L-malate synthase BshA
VAGIGNIRISRGGAEKVKIAILVLEFPPRHLAGTEIATYNLAKHLAARGHEVHVITTWDDGLPKESTLEGILVHRIRVMRIPLLGFASYFVGAFRVIVRVNPDLIHSQSIPTALHSLLMKKVLKKPYVVWARGSDIYLPSRLDKLFCRFTLKKASTVITLTADMKKNIRSICQQEAIVIPNGIDLDKFNALPRESVRNCLNVREDGKIVLFVGTLRTVKGVRYLIHAMRIVSQKELGARLILVGDGEERQYLEKLTRDLNLGDSVTFLGKVLNEKVPEYMAAADVFVLPSLSEGFPVVILEAMASGLPIIATIVRGMPEIVHDGENGFLVQARNPAQIAKRLILLLEDDQLRGKISRNNKERVNDYTWEKVIDSIEQVYRKVTGSSKLSHRYR